MNQNDWIKSNGSIPSNCTMQVEVMFSDGQIEIGRFDNFFWSDSESDDEYIVRKYRNIESSGKVSVDFVHQESLSQRKARYERCTNSPVNIRNPLISKGSCIDYDMEDIEELRELFEHDANPLYWMD